MSNWINNGVEPRVRAQYANRLLEIYVRIREAKEQELQRILAVLRTKAIADPEILEIVERLERWSRAE
jgi:hypothetical protein